MSLDFLRRDIGVVNDFFAKKNVKTMSTQETYDFVTERNIKDEEEAL
jgi:serine/threonine-protein kinase RIO1